MHHQDEDTLMGQSAIDNNYMRSGIIRDPVLWQQETERVALKLQLRKSSRKSRSGPDICNSSRISKDYGVALHKNNHHVKEEQNAIITHRSNAYLEISVKSGITSCPSTGMTCCRFHRCITPP